MQIQDRLVLTLFIVKLNYGCRSKSTDEEKITLSYAADSISNC